MNRAELIDWLNGRAEEALATSAIGHIELVRAARRIGNARVLAAQRIANSIDTLLLTDGIAATAAHDRQSPNCGRWTPSIWRPPRCTATGYRHSAYIDVRLLAAAEAEELPVTAPGR